MASTSAAARRVTPSAPEALAWVVVALWTAWWGLRQADPSAISWHFFRDGADALFGSSGLHVYADDPTLQIGPLAFVGAALAGWAGGSHAAGLVQAILTAALLPVLWAVAAHRSDEGSAVRRATRLALAGLVLAPAWTTLTVRWLHVDDALALIGIAAVVLGVSSPRGRPVLAAVAAALACAAKPWAVIALPLLLALPRPVRWRSLGYAVAGTAAAWLPFLMADPGTLDALRPKVRVGESSIMWTLGYRGTYLPAWDRLAQLVGAPLVALAAVLRGRWAGALLAGIAVRLVLDPQDLAYYAAGGVLAALVVDLHARRWVVPWTALVTALVLWQPFVADYERRFDLASGVGLWWFQHPSAVALIHLGWAVAAVVAAWWPPTSTTRRGGGARRRGDASGLGSRLDGVPLVRDEPGAVRLEAVLNAPEDGLAAAGHVHLAVGRPDVGLDRVDAEVGAEGDLLVGQPLGDERDDLGLPDGEALGASRPVPTDDRRVLVEHRTDDLLAPVDALEGGDELLTREALGQVAGGAVVQRGLDEPLVEVPCVDDGPAHRGVADEVEHLLTVGLGLGEGVVQRDVDAPSDGHGGVELDDAHPVGIGVEHPRDPVDDDLVVVGEGDADRVVPARRLDLEVTQHEP